MKSMTVEYPASECEGSPARLREEAVEISAPESEEAAARGLATASMAVECELTGQQEAAEEFKTCEAELAAARGPAAATPAVESGLAAAREPVQGVEASSPKPELATVHRSASASIAVEGAPTAVRGEAVEFPTSESDGTAKQRLGNGIHSVGGRAGWTARGRSGVPDLRVGAGCGARVGGGLQQAR